MKADKKLWLERNAVSCRVFKGKWSIRHCLKMYNDIKDLKIHMSSRGNGKVTRYESAYNPCEHCKILTGYVDSVTARDAACCEATCAETETSYREVAAL